MADSALLRLRGILAATMTRTAIDQLLTDVAAELRPDPPRYGPPAPPPRWIDITTFSGHARLCHCGYETDHWTTAERADARIEQHPATFTFTRPDGTVVQLGRWLALDPSALADAVLPEVTGG